MPIKALLWLDLETTGSNRQHDFVLEVGMVATGLNLEVVGRAEFIVAYAPAWEPRLDLLPVVRKMHTDNGLLWDCKDSQLSIAEVNERCVAFLSSAGDPLDAGPGDWLLAGSGISHFDRDYVKRDLPGVEAWLAYPNLDIGVMRRAFKYLGGEQFLVEAPRSAGDQKEHRALADATAHMLEARMFRARFADIQRQLS
jgi:oligoribonuclease